jgi:enolase
VTIDGTAFLAIPDADIPTLLQDTPYNTVKLQLCTLANISAALAICKKAKKCKMAIIAAVSDTSEYPETPDTILSDLAVGFGAKQLSAGGMAVGECCSKYNRVLEIVEESGESGVYVGAGFRVDKS